MVACTRSIRMCLQRVNPTVYCRVAPTKKENKRDNGRTTRLSPQENTRLAEARRVLGDPLYGVVPRQWLTLPPSLDIISRHRVRNTCTRSTQKRPSQRPEISNPSAPWPACYQHVSLPQIAQPMSWGSAELSGQHQKH